jgi:CRISPR-associated protein Cas4
MKESLKDVMVIGTITHQTIHEMNLAAEELACSIHLDDDFETISQLYRQKASRLLKNAILKNRRSLKMVQVPLANAFSKTWPLVEAESIQRAEQIYSHLNETQLEGEELWHSINPKIKSEYSIKSKSLGIKGIIDLLEIEDGVLRPVELKTGKQPKEGVWPGHRVQVGAYAMLLEEKFGTQIEKGVVRYLGTGKQSEIVMNPFIKEEIIQLRDKSLAILNSTEPPKICEDEQKCASCALKSRCHDEQLISDKSKDLNNSQFIVIPE